MRDTRKRAIKEEIFDILVFLLVLAGIGVGIGACVGIYMLLDIYPIAGAVTVCVLLVCCLVCGFIENVSEREMEIIENDRQRD